MPDPFAMKSGARLYRTGDIARYDTDGSIEFKGRMDHQVKIRGFRIELGEIEYALEAHPDVREAFAVVQDGPSGEPGLVAYIVPAGSDGPEPAALREWLGERLPAYMLPWALVTMQAWPLTPNGKIDQRALPRPGRPESGKSHVAPRTQTERVLCEIWSDVLGVEKIGIDDNFLDLGGHSMLIMTALRRTEQRLGVRIGLESYFIKTLKAVAAQYDQALASNVPPPRRKQRLAARMVDMIARIRGKEGSASRVPR